jgi:hypothetical protein
MVGAGGIMCSPKQPSAVGWEGWTRFGMSASLETELGRGVE